MSREVPFPRLTKTRLVFVGVVLALGLAALFPRFFGASAFWRGERVVIEAFGRDRAWQFSVGERVSQDELKLPLGAEVLINLRSEELIYVFSCPELGLKEIAVPDLEFSLSFKPDRLGNFELLMDPMCGFQLSPGKTMGRLRVVSAAEFRRWSQPSLK